MRIVRQILESPLVYRAHATPSARPDGREERRPPMKSHPNSYTVYYAYKYAFATVTHARYQTFQT